MIADHRRRVARIFGNPRAIAADRAIRPMSSGRTSCSIHWLNVGASTWKPRRTAAGDQPLRPTVMADV